MLDAENVEDLPTYDELATITKAEWERINRTGVRRPQVGEEWAEQLEKDAVVKARKRNAAVMKQKQKRNEAAARKQYCFLIGNRHCSRGLAASS